MAKVSVYEVIENVATRVNASMPFAVAVPGRAEVKADVKKWIPTKSLLLNLLLAKSPTEIGYAAGRVSELFGDYSHGKSTILQILLNGFQVSNGISVILDTESSWNRDRAVRMGHNPDRHLAVEIDTVERGFSVINSLITEFENTFVGDVPIGIGWDTIAASPTAHELADDEYAEGMMFKARFIRRELTKLVQKLSPVNCGLVFVNQTIEGPKNYTGVKTTPGGGGIKFWSSYRMQVDKVGKYNEFGNKDKVAGILSKVKMVKNKVAPPFREAVIPLNFAYGVDPIREVYDYLLDHTRILNIRGSGKAIVGFSDQDIFFHDKNARETIMGTPGLLEWMQEQVACHWFEGDTF